MPKKNQAVPILLGVGVLGAGAAVLMSGKAKAAVPGIHAPTPSGPPRPPSRPTTTRPPSRPPTTRPPTRPRPKDTPPTSPPPKGTSNPIVGNPYKIGRANERLNAAIACNRNPKVHPNGKKRGTRPQDVWLADFAYWETNEKGPIVIDPQQHKKYSQSWLRIYAHVKDCIDKKRATEDARRKAAKAKSKAKKDADAEAARARKAKRKADADAAEAKRKAAAAAKRAREIKAAAVARAKQEADGEKRRRILQLAKDAEAKRKAAEADWRAREAERLARERESAEAERKRLDAAKEHAAEQARRLGQLAAEAERNRLEAAKEQEAAREHEAEKARRLAQLKRQRSAAAAAKRRQEAEYAEEERRRLLQLGKDREAKAEAAAAEWEWKQRQAQEGVSGAPAPGPVPPARPGATKNDQAAAAEFRNAAIVVTRRPTRAGAKQYSGDGLDRWLATLAFRSTYPKAPASIEGHKPYLAARRRILKCVQGMLALSKKLPKETPLGVDTPEANRNWTAWALAMWASSPLRTPSALSNAYVKATRYLATTEAGKKVLGRDVGTKAGRVDVTASGLTAAAAIRVPTGDLTAVTRWRKAPSRAFWTANGIY